MRRRKIRDELGFTNVKWKRVLKEIVDFAPNRFDVGKNYQIGEDHELVELLKIKPHELMLSLLFLKDQGLIEFDQSEHHFINLTSKGFDVALQNQSADKATRKDRATLFLSLAITLAVVCSLLVGIENLVEKWVVTVVFVIAVVIGGYVIKKSF